MIESLPLFHRITGRVVVVLGQGEGAEAKRRLVERAGGVVVSDLGEGVAAGARIAFVACPDDAAAEAAAAQVRASGLLVNVVDRPALCDFTVPSILDRSPVLVAIGTGGASAGLAKHVRLRLERILPTGLGSLASALQQARGLLRTRFPDPADRRRALDEALGEGGALDCLVAPAQGAVSGWLKGAEVPVVEAVEIRLRSADPEDLTLREARLLGAADLVLHERGVPAAILDRARADASRCEISSGMALSAEGRAIVVLRASLPLD